MVKKNIYIMQLRLQCIGVLFVAMLLIRVHITAPCVTLMQSHSMGDVQVVLWETIRALYVVEGEILTQFLLVLEHSVDDYKKLMVKKIIIYYYIIPKRECLF
jgi:hypothetical protein